MEAIINWILENYPWVTPTLICCLVVWRVSRWTKRIDDMLHKADNLPCLQHEKDMGKFDESLRILNETNREIKDIIKRLPCDKHLSMIEKHEVRIEKEEKDILGANKRMDDLLITMSMGMSITSRKRSPYQLNEFGKHILQESHGKDCVDSNKEYLFNNIESDMHSTPYDIERAAIRAVFDLFYTDKADAVKDFIYNSPDITIFDGKEYPLRQNDIQVAMAIYLRDLYMACHE